MRVLNMILLMSFFIMTSACSPHQAITSKSSNNHAKAGWASIESGDWDSARRHFARAVGNGNLARLPQKNMAVLNYEYGRSLGVTCFFSEAEEYLLKAYQMDQQNNGPAYMDLTELARLKLDQKQFEKSSYYYKKMLSEVSHEILQQSPAVHADILDEYAITLENSGMIMSAAKQQAKARKIRENNPKAYSITERTPYGTQCNQSTVAE